MQINTNKSDKPKKNCRECGCEIVEKVDSPLYECERCMGLNEE